MRRKLTTLKAKSGGVQNGNGAGHPRALIEEAILREQQFVAGGGTPRWDPVFSGWSNATRPKNFAISLHPPLPPPS